MFVVNTFFFSSSSSSSSSFLFLFFLFSSSSSSLPLLPLPLLVFLFFLLPFLPLFPLLFLFFLFLFLSSSSSSSSSVCGSTSHLFSVWLRLLPTVTTSIVRSSLLIPVLRIWYFTVVAPCVHGAREEINICRLDNGRHYNCCNEVFGCLTATMGE